MSCEENPFFVIVKKTGTGFSFDNDVTYKSPFATHTLSQAKGVLHPSLRVQSDWGIKSKNTITQLLTGQAGAKIVRTGRGHLGSSDLLVKERVDKKTGKKTVVSRFGLLAPTLNNKGYTLTRIGDRNEGLSVAELAKLLNDIAKRPGDIKVRGSPLEYKRLLDYIQFLMVEKVSKTVKNSNGNPVQNDLYLARPNNYQVMEAVHTDGISLEEAYSGMKVEDSKMYSKAYFVTMDRVAALASVVRQIPTLYQTGTQYYYNVPTSNVIPKIRTILATRLTKIRGYTIPTNKTPMNNHPNRTQELITRAGRPVITSGPLFAWFLNTRNIGEKTNKNGKRIVGSNFHELEDIDKALILFYWVFHYPDENGRTGVNEQVIKHFLAILDTFHDFTDTKRTANFNGLWPESKNPNVYSNAKAKTRNGINNRNIPPTSIQHKFLVKLLGIDIYRKVDTYNNSLTKTISKTNRRDGTSNQRQPNIPVQLRVAHFLYFITNVLGSHPSRGLIGKCEELSRDIMIKLSNDESVNQPQNFRNPEREPGQNICKTLLEGQDACLVIDAINGSVPACMKKYSVFHNVGLLDPADKGILPWGEVVGEGGCVESARVKAAKKKRDKERMAAKKASKTRAEKAAKAKATRAQRIKNEAAAKKRNANLAAIRAKQASNRRNALMAKRRGTNQNQNIQVNKLNNTTKATNQNQNLQVNKLNNITKAKFNALGNMRMNKPKMESFKLFLNTPNFSNETVKNLLNRITYNKNKYNGTNKQIIRNVLNKILRRGKSDNLNRKAINLKSTMFANNRRQMRSNQSRT
tara:strand:+ start:1132 stop:3540 length:2409 start_codon:yes stop_codon:yes gene_type:complete